MNQSRGSLLSSLIALTMLSLSARAEDWPGWRGPRGDGTSSESGIPIKWSATENVAWKTPIPGKGHSSPAIWGDHVFLSSALEAEGKQLVFCLDRTNGKILWQ